MKFKANGWSSIDIEDTWSLASIVNGSPAIPFPNVNNYYVSKAGAWGCQEESPLDWQLTSKVKCGACNTSPDPAQAWTIRALHICSLTEKKHGIVKTNLMLTVKRTADDYIATNDCRGNFRRLFKAASWMAKDEFSLVMNEIIQWLVRWFTLFFFFFVVVTSSFKIVLSLSWPFINFN